MIKNNTKNRVKGLIPLFFLLAVLGCKKESSEIGANLRGDDGLIGDSSVVYSNIISRSAPGDTLRTNDFTSNAIGVIEDPIFGTRKASLVIQPRLAEVGRAFDGKQADSIFLILRYDVDATGTEGTAAYDLTYGDTNSVIELDVYKLDEDLVDTASYYSNYQPTLGSKIGSFSGNFRVRTQKTQIVSGDTFVLAPELIIPLDKSFGQELMEFDSSAYVDNDAFVQALKGLVIIPKSTPVSGEGAMAMVESTSSVSGLLLHYGDSLTKTYPLSSSSKTIGFFENTISPTITSQYSSTTSFSKVYAQSMAGGKIKIDIPELNDIIEMGDEIVINEAKLEITLDETTVIDHVYDAPPFLWMLIPDTANLSRALIQFDGTDELGDPRFSVAEKAGSTYDFYFNRYLQQLVKTYNVEDKNIFNGFYITVPENSPRRPYRVVLNTDETIGDIKVSVTYTKLN